MDSKLALNIFPNNPAHKLVLGGLLAGAIMLSSALAAAQDVGNTPSREQPDFFGTIKGWFNQATDNFNAGISGVRKRFETLSDDAGIAARSTVDTAKDAANAVTRLPNTTVVYGHEECKIAPNGAPDCVAAAIAMCKGKGLESGTSLDMTTAEVCPAQVYLSGRNTGEGCHTETFVSRALCK